ncbi:MAG TPA: metallophosphoesterase [Gemmataceae bacterium]
MPDPDRLLNTLRQARAAILATPGRAGRFVELSGAEEVLVAGDMHGHLGNFRAVLALADLAHHPGRHLVLQELIHGPYEYPGGGDKSHQLVDLFAALKCQYPQRVHFLPGNHELAQWTGRPVSKAEVNLNAYFYDGVLYAYGLRAGEIYEAYKGLFAVLPLALRTPNRVFVSHSVPSARHAGDFDLDRLRRDELDEEDLRPGGAVYGLLWGRDASEDNAAAFLRRVDADLLVTGHIPSEQGFHVPNSRQVIVDCADSPAACCLFPADRPLTHEELKGCVRLL